MDRTEPHEITTVKLPKYCAHESYLIYHEELESLVKHFPTLKRARFWMTFGTGVLNHLRGDSKYWDGQH